MSELDEIQVELAKFESDRDWQQFHSPENLAKSISIEAGELLQLYQWETPTGNVYNVAMELADIMIYCLMMCSAKKIDPILAIREKMQINEAKYPVAKAKGNCKKADEL
jgi:NTP pyrophosphatase (non-canonical NTP hydrolase)